jgi:zinc protease
MKLGREDAMEFYRTYYTPKNAIVIVAGDVTAEEVRRLAEKHYAPLKNTADPGPRVRTPEPEPIAARRVVLVDPRAASPSIRRSYLAPSYATAEPGEAEALDVLAKVLGGGTTSRLYRKLVVEDKIAAYAGASYYGDGLDSATVLVYAAPNPGGRVEEIEPVLDEVLANIAANGITEEELTRARNGLIADTVYALDNQFRLAYMFGVALTNGLTVEDVTGWTKRVEKVTKEDVQKAAQKVLRSERSVTGILLPDAGRS